MITCRILLCGGLGNQLFQYAFARALALRSGATLILDALTLFARDSKYQRSYALNGFDLPSDVLVCRRGKPGERLIRKFNGLLDHFRPLNKRTFILEKRPLRYSPEDHALVIKRSVTLLGYWNCDRYFAEIERQLRCDLRFTGTVAKERQDLARMIKTGTSVAIHVRRVDYERKLSPAYYLHAVAQMRRRVKNPRFFVFTDDPEWWLSNGERGFDIHLVQKGSLPAIEDLRMMSQCEHFIIANSSFSGWAAWLGQSRDGVVIAPSEAIWDNNENILRDSWHRIPVDREGQCL